MAAIKSNERNEKEALRGEEEHEKMIQRYGLIWNGLNVKNDKRDDAPYVLYIDHLEVVERRKLLHDAEIVEKEKQIAALRRALERIEAGCSFPEDDVQKAIVKVAREALRGGETK